MSKAQYFKTVSVDEALPEDQEYFFCTTEDDGKLVSGFFLKKKAWEENNITHWLQPITVPDAISDEEIMLESESFCPGDEPEQHNSQSCFMAGARWANKRLSAVIAELCEERNKFEKMALEYAHDSTCAINECITKNAQIEALREALDSILNSGYGQERSYAAQVSNIKTIAANALKQII